MLSPVLKKSASPEATIADFSTVSNAIWGAKQLATAAAGAVALTATALPTQTAYAEEQQQQTNNPKKKVRNCFARRDHCLNKVLLFCHIAEHLR